MISSRSSFSFFLSLCCFHILALSKFELTKQLNHLIPLESLNSLMSKAFERIHSSLRKVYWKLNNQFSSGRNQTITSTKWIQQMEEKQIQMQISEHLID